MILSYVHCLLSLCLVAVVANARDTDLLNTDDKDLTSDSTGLQNILRHLDSSKSNYEQNSLLNSKRGFFDKRDGRLAESVGEDAKPNSKRSPLRKKRDYRSIPTAHRISKRGFFDSDMPLMPSMWGNVEKRGFFDKRSDEINFTKRGFFDKRSGGGRTTNMRSFLVSVCPQLESFKIGSDHGVATSTLLRKVGLSLGDLAQLCSQVEYPSNTDMNRGDSDLRDTLNVLAYLLEDITSKDGGEPHVSILRESVGVKPERGAYLLDWQPEREVLDEEI